MSSIDAPFVLQLDSEPLESWKLKVLLVWFLKLIIADIGGHKNSPHWALLGGKKVGWIADHHRSTWRGCLSLKLHIADRHEKHQVSSFYIFKVNVGFIFIIPFFFCLPAEREQAVHIAIKQTTIKGSRKCISLCTRWAALKTVCSSPHTAWIKKGNYIKNIGNNSVHFLI